MQRLVFSGGEAVPHVSFLNIKVLCDSKVDMLSLRLCMWCRCECSNVFVKYQGILLLREPQLTCMRCVS